MLMIRLLIARERPIASEFVVIVKIIEGYNHEPKT